MLSNLSIIVKELYGVKLKLKELAMLVSLQNLYVKDKHSTEIYKKNLLKQLQLTLLQRTISIGDLISKQVIGQIINKHLETG